ncbi:MAG: ribonuclease P protein component [Actinomycetes bacterium]
MRGVPSSRPAVPRVARSSPPDHSRRRSTPVARSASVTAPAGTVDSDALAATQTASVAPGRCVVRRRGVERRLRRSADISRVLRRGVRASGGRPPLLVVHMCWRNLGISASHAGLQMSPSPSPRQSPSPSPSPSVDASGVGTSSGARLAFAIPRAVGNAVVRNRLRRQVRGLLAPRLDAAPELDVVVRVLPAAADASRAAVAAAVESGWQRALRGVQPSAGDTGAVR